jgi:hypothetical protein
VATPEMSNSDARSRDWQKLYEAAVLELDPAVLATRVQAAKAAIHSRMVELGTSQPVDEDSRLEGALKILDGLLRMYY